MSPCYKIICKADIHSRPLSGFYARAVFFSTDPEHDFLVLKPWKTHSVRVFQDVNIVPYFCGIWIDHVPLCTHIYLFFLFQRSVREADVLLTGKNNLRWKQGRGGGGGEKNIWICKSCHSVEPCNEWEMQSPSFIMQRSLLNARQLGLASSHHASPSLSCHLTATWTRSLARSSAELTVGHMNMQRHIRTQNTCVWQTYHFSLDFGISHEEFLRIELCLSSDANT